MNGKRRRNASLRRLRKAAILFALGIGLGGCGTFAPDGRSPPLALLDDGGVSRFYPAGVEVPGVGAGANTNGVYVLTPQALNWFLDSSAR